jgi:uncharacterized protein YcbX
MRQVGIIKSIYRYPVKSMAGEELPSAVLGWHGIEGDRRFAFMLTGNLSGMPWLTASKMPELIRYKAFYQGGASHPAVRIRTPAGEDLDLENALLLQQIAAAFGSGLELVRIDNGIFDDSPVSLISTATIKMLEAETGFQLDVRRFRPNLLIESTGDAPVPEEAWIGKTVLFGNHAGAPSVRVTIKDIRCVIVNFDPETAVAEPHIFKTIVRSRQNCAGVYASVMNPGTLSIGDGIYLNDN